MVLGVRALRAEVGLGFVGQGFLVASGGQVDVILYPFALLV